MTPILSIFIPSNRCLGQSKLPLDSMISYARQRGIEIVISDNSGDSEKQRYLSAVDYDKLRYVQGPSDGFQNWWNAFTESSGDYVASLSDDDYLFYLSGCRPSIPSGCIGLRPCVNTWTPSAGFGGATNFSILDDSPLGRIKRYPAVNTGTNTTYSSFWRRDQYARTAELMRHHPLRLGYEDWALVYSLLALGPVVGLSDSLLVYNMSNWTDEAAKDKLERMLAPGKFCSNAIDYLLFLEAIDAFILTMRHDNGLNIVQKRDAALFILMFYLTRFKGAVESKSHSYNEADRIFVASLDTPQSPTDLFAKIPAFLEALRPGLALAYESFWNLSIQEDWGRF